MTITVGLATEITGTLDPTPISDGINAGTLAIEGEWGQATVVVSTSWAPGGLGKLAKYADFAKYAKHVPTGSVDEAIETLARQGDELASRADPPAHRDYPPIRGSFPLAA